MRITRSPSRSPACFAGFTVPAAVCTSEKPTTSAPSENIFTPKGVPHTVTVGRCITVARMVLTGSQPPSASVV